MTDMTVSTAKPTRGGKWSPLLKDLAWIAALSLGLGALLALLDGGTWLKGWGAYSLVLLAGIGALTAVFRRSGSPPPLAWMLVLAFGLRLALGVAMTFIFPEYGFDTQEQNAGYVFPDAWNRDVKSWQLAHSERPLWRAFDKKYSVDQYGGMLFMSAALYRGLSADMHRPWLILALTAAAGSLAVALAWRTAEKLWGTGHAKVTGWIMALYPYAWLLGSSQMREPWLALFVTMLFWGAVSIQSQSQAQSQPQQQIPRPATRSGLWPWLWIGGGVLGGLLFSPGAGIAALGILAVWAWLRGGRRRIPWQALVGGAVVAALGLVLLWLGLKRSLVHYETFGEVLTHWFQNASIYQVSLLGKNSGAIAALFERLPGWMQVPFAAVYGLLQPVLPATLVDKTLWPWQTLSISLAAGWYLLLPLLVFAVVPIVKLKEKNERLAWLWLWLAAWGWNLVCAVRAGGDQWDNPRYRVIFLLLLGLLAAQAWSGRRDPWLGRILAIEGIFLAFFLEWYLARTLGWSGLLLPFEWVAGMIALLGIAVVVGGIVWDKRKRRKIT